MSALSPWGCPVAQSGCPARCYCPFSSCPHWPFWPAPRAARRWPWPWPSWSRTASTTRCPPPGCHLKAAPSSSQVDGALSASFLGKARRSLASDNTFCSRGARDFFSSWFVSRHGEMSLKSESWDLTNWIFSKCTGFGFAFDTKFILLVLKLSES